MRSPLLCGPTRNKTQAHPVVGADGRRVVNAEFFPFVVSPFGALSPDSNKFLLRFGELRPRRFVRFRNVIAVKVVKEIAHRLREGIGFSDLGWGVRGGQVGGPSAQGSDRPYPPACRGESDRSQEAGQVARQGREAGAGGKSLEREAISVSPERLSPQDYRPSLQRAVGEAEHADAVFEAAAAARARGEGKGGTASRGKGKGRSGARAKSKGA